MSFDDYGTFPSNGARPCVYMMIFPRMNFVQFSPEENRERKEENLEHFLSLNRFFLLALFSGMKVSLTFFFSFHQIFGL